MSTEIKINNCNHCGWTYSNRGSGKKLRKYCDQCKEDKQQEFNDKVIKQSKGESLS